LNAGNASYFSGLSPVSLRPVHNNVKVKIRL